MTSWKTSSQSDLSKCSIIPSSIQYQEVQADENDDDDSSSPKTNRMAIANKSFAAGDMILRNAPLTCSFLMDQKYCAYCFGSSDQHQLSRCARCQSSWYCSKDCQKLDFALHKQECLYWTKKKKKKNTAHSTLQNGRIKAEISLLIRTRAKIEQLQAKEEQDEATFPQTTSPQTVIHSRIQHLTSLSQYPFTLDPTEDSIIQEAATAILWFQQDQHTKDNTKKVQSLPEIQTELQDLLRIFRVNNFGITDELHKVIASAVYPLGALLNHSCSPNCLLRYQFAPNQPPILEIVASRPIDKGEELTHSYVELVQPRLVRQERLKSNYGFNCRCTRCITLQEGSSSSDMPKDSMQLQDAKQVQIFLDYFNPCYPSHQKWTCLPNDTSERFTDDEVQELRQMVAHIQVQARQSMGMDDVPGELFLWFQCIGILTRLLKRQLNDNDATSCRETCLELYQVRGDYLGSLLVAGETENAIAECEYIVAFLVSVLCDSDTNCPNHPILGLQLFTLGDLYSAVGMDDKAQRTFEWAGRILEVSHGSDSNMVQLLTDR